MKLRAIWTSGLVLVLTMTAVATAGDGLSAEEKAEGYVSLFNGKNLDGWQGAVNGYTADNGILRCNAGSGGKLYTAKQYSNFSFRFEFKMPAGANNGVGIRTPLQGDPAYVGMEIQILDNDDPAYKNIKPYQAHGSVYGVVAAKQGHLKPDNEWNVEEIIADGNHIIVKLNGVTIVDADIKEASTPKTLDGRDHPGLKNTEGYIGFLGHGHDVEFRNIRIKEL